MISGTIGRLNRYFLDYESSHRTAGNRISHEIGIPLIVVSLLGLLSGLSPFGGGLNLGLLLWALCTAWYGSLCFSDGRFVWSHFTLVAPYSVVTLGAYFAGAAIPARGLWVLFVLGWVFQAIGHAVYEKRSPAFFTNLRHLLIGPLWIFSRIFRG